MTMSMSSILSVDQTDSREIRCDSIDLEKLSGSSSGTDAVRSISSNAESVTIDGSKLWRFGAAVKRLVGRTIVAVVQEDGKFGPESLLITLDDGTIVTSYDGEQYTSTFGLKIDGLDILDRDSKVTDLW